MKAGPREMALRALRETRGVTKPPKAERAPKANNVTRAKAGRPKALTSAWRNSGPMKKPRWYVTCSEYATSPKKGERIWTLSRRTTSEGWTTDGGHEGYGLTYREAKELADAANEAWRLR